MKALLSVLGVCAAVTLIVAAVVLFGVVPTRVPHLQLPVTFRSPVAGWTQLWASPALAAPPKAVADPKDTGPAVEEDKAVEEPAAAEAPAPKTAGDAAPAEVEQPIGLKYDEEGCEAADFSDCLSEGQELASWPVRRAQEGVWGAADNEAAQQAMVDAIVKIQQMSAAAGAEMHEGDPLELNFGSTYLVWCSNAEGSQVPADVALPLTPTHLGWGQIYIWAPPAHYEQAPDPSRFTFSGCEGSEFWAVALR